MRFRLFLFTLVCIAVVQPLFVYASFLPGETLDPPCLPTDPTCIVVAQTSTDIIPSTDGTLDIGSSTQRFRNAYLSGTLSAALASTTSLTTGSLSVGSLNGFLKAVAGAVSTALVNLASDVTGILSIANGGTGTSSIPSYGKLLVGNAAGGYDLVATSSLSISNVVWGNVSGTLNNQTDLQNALDTKFSLSSWYATSTDALSQGTTNKYYATSLFASDLAATTTDAVLEGLSHLYFTNNRVAGVLAGTSTTALAEGNNLYYTSSRVDARINATSSIGTLTAAPALGSLSTSLTGVLRATAGSLSTASVNLASDVSGTLPVAQGGTGATSFGQGWVFSSGGTGTLSASTSPTVNYITATSTTATSTFANGINISGGCLAVAGVCISGGGGGVGITTLNGLVGLVQTFATSSSGSDFNISSLATTHTFNIPDASAVNRGLVTIGTQTFGGTKIFTNLISLTNASTSLSSVFQKAYFGGSATTTIDSAGNIFGAGTLIVNAATTSSLFSTNLLSNTASFGATATSTFTSAGALGIASTTPWGLLSIEQGTEARSLVVSNTGSTTPSLVVMGVNGNGNVGVATTTPWRPFSVSGKVSFASDGLTSGLGSGSLCLTTGGDVTYNAGSNSCQSSSRRFKHNIVTSTAGLDEVLKFRPVTFEYNADQRIPGTRIGFIAEEVAAIDPLLAHYDSSGAPDSVEYDKFSVVLVKAFQDLVRKLSDAVQATTGIFDRIFATDIEAKNIKVHELCVKDVCITRDQLAALLANVGKDDRSPRPAPGIPTRPDRPDRRDTAPTANSTPNTSLDLGTLDTGTANATSSDPVIVDPIPIAEPPESTTTVSIDVPSVPIETSPAAEPAQNSPEATQSPATTDTTADSETPAPDTVTTQ